MVNMPGEVIIVLEAGSVQHLRDRAIAKGKSPTSVGLILNGAFIKGAAMRLEPLEMPDKVDVVRFTIAYRDEDSKALNKILVEQGATGISVSVGFEDGEMMRSDSAIDVLPATSDNQMAFGLAVILIVCLYLMMTRSAMLREPGQGVSLGRTQMAWWTMLSSWGFVYLYNFSGALELTKSMVVLMGISSATALAAVFIDKRKAEHPGPAAQAEVIPAAGPCSV